MGRYIDFQREVLRISCMLSEQGYFGPHSGTAGNVSMLIPGEEAAAITPTAMRYDDMTAADVCVVDLDGVRIEGIRKPSIEMQMHLAAYRRRPDVGAVIHTHQVCASALGLIGEPIPALFDEVTLAIGPLVDIVPYSLSGTRELHEAVAAKLGNRCHCYIIQNHGAICVGPDLDRTFTFVELLEKTAAVYLHALATGRPVSRLPEAVAQELFAAVKARQDREVARTETTVTAKQSNPLRARRKAG
ncbi:MAG TPA: class II aldolase/adducin family protein [Candidatus Binataceae bacterium]|nr:class II aldolase/adducin family protein [Candidatus Binataceae bacterium]